MIFLCPSIWVLLMPLIVLDTFNTVAGKETAVDPNDIHGGVPMGDPNAECDDGETNTKVDWDPNSTKEYTCTEGIRENYKVGLHDFHCEQQQQQPLHVCYPHAINYTENLPTSGAHRPLWPEYGEYRFIPIQRYLHSLEHGAVVFLYHPCADPQQIEEFKAVAEGCLWRRVISPNNNLPTGMNFALLSWKCKLVLSSVDVPLIVDFVKTRARQAPEDVSRDGQYKIGLIKHSTVVSDIDDNELCPSMSILSERAKDFRDKSIARRSNYKRLQENLEQLMNTIMGKFTD